LALARVASLTVRLPHTLLFDQADLALTFRCPLSPHAALTGSMTTWFNHVVAPVLQQHLGDSEYINGPNFTATDVYVGFSLFVAETQLGLLQTHKQLKAYLYRLMARPAFQAALKGWQ